MLNSPKKLLISIDVDGETPYLWLNKGGHIDDACEYEQRRFGPRKCCYRILKLLHLFNIKATFFIPAYIIKHYPILIKSIQEEGHEIALHGYLHENTTTLSLQENKALLAKCLSITQEHKLDIKGYRAPFWKMPEYLPDLLFQFGIHYDSSIPIDSQPYRYHNLIEFPVNWQTDDATYLFYTGGHQNEVRPVSNDQFVNIILAEANAMLKYNNYACLTLHPWISGRAVILDSWHEIFSELLSNSKVRTIQCGSNLNGIDHGDDINGY